MHVVLILGILLFIIIIDSYFENRSLTITSYEVHSEHIPESFCGSKFLVLADLHNNSFGKDNSKLLDEIDKIKPDYILVAGDMIVGKKANDYSVPLSLLSKLSSHYPIFYGLGNHEQKVMSGGENYDGKFDQFKEELESLGVHFLVNNQVRISHKEDNMVITGLLIGHEYFKKLKQPKLKTEYLENLVGIADKQCYNILIAHNPVYFSNYIEWGADLIVSGHIHGGIIRLPAAGGIISPQYKLFPKYDAGQFESKGKTMLVSRGLGLHTIKIRVFNRPELMVVTLERKL